MSVKVIDILLNENSVANYLCPELPRKKRKKPGKVPGKKTVVDNNEVNNNIQNNRGKSKFPDDCGVLSDSSTTKKHYYIIENRSPVFIELKSNNNYVAQTFTDSV